jgi:hypothetical protein
MEIDPVSETCSLVFRVLNNGQSPKNPVILRKYTCFICCADGAQLEGVTERYWTTLKKFLQYFTEKE